MYVSVLSCHVRLLMCVPFVCVYVLLDHSEQCMLLCMYVCVCVCVANVTVEYLFTYIFISSFVVL